MSTLCKWFLNFSTQRLCEIGSCIRRDSVELGIKEPLSQGKDKADIQTG